jgi:hypothetical protein
MKDVVFDEERWTEIKSRLLYRPLADTFTFGLYSKIKGIEQQ